MALAGFIKTVGLRISDDGYYVTMFILKKNPCASGLRYTFQKRRPHCQKDHAFYSFAILTQGLPLEEIPLLAALGRITFEVCFTLCAGGYAFEKFCNKAGGILCLLLSLLLSL